MAHIFSGKKTATEFAKTKNRKVRKGRWVVQKGRYGGWVVWHRKTPSQKLLQ